MKYTRWSSLAGIALLMASAQAFAVKQIISVEEAEVAVGPEASLVSFSSVMRPILILTDDRSWASRSSLQQRSGFCLWEMMLRTDVTLPQCPV